jgi:hypothetical protein
MSHILTFLFLSVFGFSSHAVDNSFHIQTRGTETWVQLKFNPVVSSVSADILFVIDDSGSMDVHQKNLSKNLEAFIDSIPQSNLQVGILTTSTVTYAIPHIPGHLINGVHKSSDPNFVTNVKKSLLVGFQGSGEETPFDSLSLALSEPLLSTVNAGFLRPTSDLYIVFLTDSQDQSKIDENALYTQIKALKPQQTITSLAAMSDASTTCPTYEAGELKNHPPKIQNFVGLTGGSVFSICDDFSTSLTKAINVSLMTENTLVLVGTETLKTPKFSTIQVKVGIQSYLPGDIATGWIYNAATKTITFSDLIINESVAKGPIEVTYQVQ